MTPAEIGELAGRLAQGTRKDALVLAASLGVSVAFTDAVRRMQGMTSNQRKHIPRESIEWMVEYHKEHPDTVVKFYADKLGVSQSQACLYLKKAGLETAGALRYWTKIEKMRLVDMVKKGNCADEISTRLGKTKTAIYQMVRKLREVEKIDIRIKRKL